MLPSRSRLQDWRPNSLEPASARLGTAGEYVYGAVRALDDGCDRMPEAETWSGEAHTAASKMFGRATKEASAFARHAEAIADALAAGAGTIGTARANLMRHADEIDGGDLEVSDMWVVLIKPVRVSAEKATSVLRRKLVD